ncbi:Mono- and diacylglycerol lipase [Madurella mycetomatis]|uniref:Mono- and diacylglycerol lipase n=1 Tax=Madurella mycetomatis TaxID=100816 RepID=A0A175W2Y2_9PEZI|nr:Mono- and diacylglycerol lipase [Madurella mycetomatis]
MWWFTKTKKVKKESPKPAPKDHKRTSHQHRLLLPPPPPPPPPNHYHEPASFQPAGLLPPPSGWNGMHQSPRAFTPIVVNQHHYYLGGSPPSQASEPPRTSNSSLGKLRLGSAVDLAKDMSQGTCIPQLIDDTLTLWQGCGGGQLVNQGNLLMDEISNRLDDVLTMIDRGHCNGKERDILAWQPAQSPSHPPPYLPPSEAPVRERSAPKPSRKSHSKGHPKGQTTAAATVVSGSIFSRVELYANSRLPMNLPPLKLYIPTYPLLCLAAQYSEHVYDRPKGAERDAHVDADWRTGTKAMVIKSVPMDYMNTIVFAIRGTATFMDWAVNLNMEPTSPAGFLDDTGNLCHAGFLSVARKMVSPVARRLRQLLEEDPGRASYSLLITGHSAGGAVASLLYSHMLSTSKSAESELNTVAGCFKRIHCITFGTPPVSLIPLAKPDDYNRRPQLRKSLFLSFVNEGDPVPRADKAYVKSLLELFTAPAPRPAVVKAESSESSSKKGRKGDKPPSKAPSKLSTVSGSSSKTRSSSPVWKVPPSTLSCAGRIVVLRSGDPKARLRRRKTTVEERLHEGVVAQIATDEQLRGVVWGDPVSHMMRLYAGRIETLAVGAVTGKGC